VLGGRVGAAQVSDGTLVRLWSREHRTEPEQGGRPMKLFLFDDVPGDTKIAVNPDQIRYLRAGPEGQVVIVFDQEHSVTVAGTLTDVVSHLKS
jgi:uncharacterized protein YheU (UPF0270 family)